MKTTMMLIAGLMILSPAFGKDSGFEERNRMKTGRYTASPKQGADCAMGCCARHNQQAIAYSGAEARFRMKLGRSSPVEESRIAASAAPKKIMEMPVMSCGMDVANQVEQPVAANSAVTPGDSGAEARFRMKLGRSSPIEESRLAAATNSAAPAAMCEHACRQHGM